MTKSILILFVSIRKLEKSQYLLYFHKLITILVNITTSFNKLLKKRENRSQLFFKCNMIIKVANKNYKIIGVETSYRKKEWTDISNNLIRTCECTFFNFIKL